MTNTMTLAIADTNGNVQGLNVGTSDNAVPIYYELETQEVEFGNRAHLKKIADKMTVLSQSGLGSSTIQASQDGGDFKNLIGTLERTVNIIQDMNLEGFFFSFKWFGYTSTSSPIFEGLYFENVTDLGITRK